MDWFQPSWQPINFKWIFIVYYSADARGDLLQATSRDYVSLWIAIGYQFIWIDERREFAVPFHRHTAKPDALYIIRADLLIDSVAVIIKSDRDALAT